ncbi:hypothetical protein L484_014605 [Morus notabilis]|uniref:Uncharacterized protein n=1 Tax=Morus notabilis TaxID=981085 RepID=W9QYF5_9ROSA|nr:hypothetical protein L484_014605 [Morus notabilis]
MKIITKGVDQPSRRSSSANNKPAMAKIRCLVTTGSSLTPCRYYSLKQREKRKRGEECEYFRRST